jgi:uncharacterized protein
MSGVFEFDNAKSAANKLKHGIDFVEAQALWADGKLLNVPTRFIGEVRWVAIGSIDGKQWTAVYTWREEAVRIISVRRARDYEIENYFRQGI